MKLVKTVQCKLEVDERQRTVLLDTISKFGQACNDALKVAKETKTWRRYNLHGLCYYELRKRYGLAANYIVHAIARVCAKRRRKPKSFKATSLDLDKWLFRFIEQTETVSISTMEGRLKIKLALGNFQRGLLKGQKPTSATLIYQKSRKRFFINFVLDHEIPVPFGSNPVGIDRGIYNLATTSNGLKFSGKQAKHVRSRYFKLRRSLQAKGTKGAKCALIRLSGRERRWMTDLNHVISRRIVDSCKQGDLIALEDLRFIRARIKTAKKHRMIAHSWAFGQLGEFISYKAAEKGIPVYNVDPAYTSQRCPVCQTIASINRKSHRFFCSHCGYRAHSDYVASLNIRQASLLALADGLPSLSPGTSPPACARAGVSCPSLVR